MESFLAVRQSDWAVHGLPAFNDNYLWAIVHLPTKRCSVVDPGDAQVVQAFVSRHGLQLESILLTHHHPDHIGGLSELTAAAGADRVSVWGPATGRIQGITHPVSQGQTVRTLGLELQVLELAGHTRDHLGYAMQGLPLGHDARTETQSATAPDNAQSIQATSWLFCGDTLFSGGCGRLFEGTPADMHASLQKINRLPASTLCFCAHEYTLSNLRFALAQEPDNVDLQQYFKHCTDIRSQDKPTIPSSLETERRINLFLRAQSASQLKTIREAKDAFKG